MKTCLFTICIHHLILTKRSYMRSAGWTKIGSDGWRRMKRRLFAIFRVRKRRWRRRRQCERLMCWGAWALILSVSFVFSHSLCLFCLLRLLSTHILVYVSCYLSFSLSLLSSLILSVSFAISHSLCLFCLLRSLSTHILVYISCHLSFSLSLFHTHLNPPKNGLIALWSATNGRLSTF